MRHSADSFVGPADGALPDITDGPAAQIREFIANEDHRLRRRYVKELNDSIIGNVGLPASHSCSGAEAAQYIDACINATEAILKARHSAYSPLRWLWYLRRTPDELFIGDHPTTHGYDRLLAECLTWLLDSSDQRVISETPLRFPVDVSICRQIVRLVGGVKYLSDLHVQARYAGKGVSFLVSDSLRPLSRIPDPVIENAVTIYDQRLLEEDRHVYAGLGVSRPPAKREVASDSIFDLCLLIRCEPHSVRCNVLTKGGYVDGNISCRSTFQTVPAKQLLLPFGHSLVDESYPSSQTMCLVMFCMAYPLFFARLPWCVGSVLQHGYFVVRDSLAIEILADVLTPVRDHLQMLGYNMNLPGDALAWLQTLEDTAPSLWPFVRAGFVRRRSTLLAFDIALACHAVLDFFRAKRLSGEAGNQRARQFELNIQASIGTTTWKPPPEIAALRGRKLTIQGSAITDIDAVAAHGKRLLLISCKSLIYDAEYDAGRFSPVRHASDVVSVAVAEWSEKMKRIERLKRGDNFDLSAYDEFIGVVCTPFAPYVSDAASLAFVQPGLRAACSASELIGWLSDVKR